MRILAIDPGPEQSAYVAFAEDRPKAFGIWANGDILTLLAAAGRESMLVGMETTLVIEWVSFYGKEIHPGSETFHTCRQVGRFQQAWNDDATCELIERRAVRSALCGTMKAGDAEVRAVLIDRYGGKEKAIGRKATPGPLHGISSHVWSALAVAVVYADRQRGEVGTHKPISDDKDLPF